MPYATIGENRKQTGSSNIIPGSWHELSGGGLKFMWETMSTDFSGVPASSSAENLTLSTPLGMSTSTIVMANMRDNTGSNIGDRWVLLSSLDSLDTVPSDSNCTIREVCWGDVNSGTINTVEVETDTNSNIRLRATATNGYLLYISTIGYYDNR